MRNEKGGVKMLNIVCGYSAGGKSTLLLEYLQKALNEGKEAIFIVPEQQLVVTERRIADMVRAEDSLRVEVLSFRRLANRVFREYGGLCYNYFGKGADILLMWKALGGVAPFLSVYKDTEPDDLGTVEALLGARQMLKRGGVGIANMQKATLMLEGEDDRLKQKLEDLSLVFSLYDNIRQSRFDDPLDDLTRMCEMKSTVNFFKDKVVLFDSFNSLTYQEYAVVEKVLMGARDVFFTVNTYKNESRDIFSKSTKYLKTLLRIAKRTGVQVNVEYVDRENPVPQIQKIKKELFSPISTKCIDQEENAVKIVKCTDSSSQVEWVMEDILRYVKNEGGRYRDCVIASGDISGYTSYIKGLCQKLGIPVFISERHSLIGGSAIRSIRYLMSVLCRDYRAQDVIEYVKTGFSPIEESDARLLERYLRTWNINGKKRWSSTWGLNPEGRRTEKTEKSERTLEKLNLIRQALNESFNSLEAAFSSEGTVGEKVRALTDYLVRIKMPSLLEIEAKKANESSDKVGVQYYKATWKCIVTSLEIMNKVLENDKMPLTVFSRLFECVIAKNDIGIIPTSSDEVLTGNIDMLRVSSNKRLYVLGLNDGEFPTVSENGIFTDRECICLDGAGLEIFEDSEQRLFDSLFSLYTLSSSCEGSIAYLYSSAGKRKPSSVIHSLKSVLGENIQIDAPEKTLSQVMYGVSDAENKLVDDGFIGEENLKRLYSDRIKISQSKLDRFVNCPFSYAYTYLLRLREEGTPEVSTDVFGTIIHMIFELFMKLAETKDGGIKDISDDEAEQIIESVISQYYKESGSDEEDDIRVYHLFRRIKSTAFYLIKDLRGEFVKSKYRPIGFELRVGEGADVESPEITLEDGTRVMVEGVIDRVDSYLDKDGNAYIKIVDYKTGDRDITDAEIARGQKLQLPLYMSAICSSRSQALRKITGRAENGRYIPAGMVYHIAKAPKKTQDPDEFLADRNGFVLNSEANLEALGDFKGLKAGRSEEEMEKTLSDTVVMVREIAQRMKNGECGIFENTSEDACKYCKMFPICRINKNSRENIGKES